MALAERMTDSRHTALVPRKKPDNYTVQTLSGDFL